MRRWVVTLGFFGGCTALNPAFGDADRGTGSTSKAESTTNEPSTAPTLDPTRGTSSSSTSSDAETTESAETTLATTRPMTSDDDTSTPTTSTDEGSSDLGVPGAHVLLFTASIDDGNLAEKGGAAAVRAAAAICTEASNDLQADVCSGSYHALIRVAAIPFTEPELVANLGNPVVSVEGEAIAQTLQDFIDGVWLVPTLTEVAGGGLPELVDTSLATGGLSNNDLNCVSWSTLDADLTIGDPDGGDGWFSATEIACASPTRMLCVCLP